MIFQDKGYKDKRREELPRLIEEVIVKPNGEKLKKNYLRGKFITEHQNGQYFEVKDPASFSPVTTHMIKIISKDELIKNKNRSKLLAEINNHMTLSKYIRNTNTSNILKLEKVFEDSKYVYLLMQYCPHGNLEQLLNRRSRLSELQLQYYFKQLLNMLTVMKNQKIVHGDIRLESLRIDANMNLKLCDFGESISHNATPNSSNNITSFQRKKPTHYSSPQAILQSNYSYETDMWSMGVVLYTLLTGCEPFINGNSFSLTKIGNANYKFPHDLKIQGPWEQIIKKMLVVDVQKRATIEELSEIVFEKEVHYLDKSLLTVPNRLQTPQQEANRISAELYKSSFLAGRSKPTEKKSAFRKLFDSNFTKTDQQIQTDEGDSSGGNPAEWQAISEIQISAEKFQANANKAEKYRYVKNWTLRQDIGLMYTIIGNSPQQPSLFVTFNDKNVIGLNPVTNSYEFLEANFITKKWRVVDDAKSGKEVARKIAQFRSFRDNNCNSSNSCNFKTTFGNMGSSNILEESSLGSSYTANQNSTVVQLTTYSNLVGPTAVHNAQNTTNQGSSLIYVEKFERLKDRPGCLLLKLSNNKYQVIFDEASSTSGDSSTKNFVLVREMGKQAINFENGQVVLNEKRQTQAKNIVKSKRGRIVREV